VDTKGEMLNKPTINLREFKNHQSDEVISLFQKTFSDSEGNEEGICISALVNQLILTTDLPDIHIFIAMDNDKIVGCTVFSRVFFDDSIESFILSPMAVDTDYQGLGIGTDLIVFSAEILRDKEVKFIFTYGDPRFYSRAGFCAIDPMRIKPPFPLQHPEGWLGQSLGRQNINDLKGRLKCVDPLNRKELW
jgi:putative acetyltransferase